MILKYDDYTNTRLEEEVWRYKNYYNLQASNTYGKNDQVDAFRTAYKQAYITYYYGSKVAKRHIEKPSNSDYTSESLAEDSMRLWNSRVGREAAKELIKITKNKKYSETQVKSMLASAIAEKLYDGKMITSLNDTRKYKDFEKEYFNTQATQAIQNPQSEVNNLPPGDKILEGQIEQNDYYSEPPINTYEKTPCVGTVKVRPYKRNNGTEVEGYTRTCGAKHLKKVVQETKLGNNNLSYINGNIQLSSPWNTPYNISKDQNALELQSILSTINKKTNTNYIDAKMLMDISIYRPKSYIHSKKFKYLTSKDIINISKILNIETKEKLDGIFFDINSTISQNIIKSPEFINKIKEEQSKGFPNKKITLSFNKDTNLFRALHNVTICNIYKDKNGYINCTLFDLYDFAFLIKQLYSQYPALITIANDLAYLLQQLKILEKYYIFINLKFKL